MSEQTEEFNALQPLTNLFNQVIVEDKQQIENELQKLKENVNALIKIVLSREIFKKREEFLRKLVEIGDAVGDCLRLAAKHRYPTNSEVPVIELPERRQSQAPVIVQATPQPQSQTGGVRGFLAGYWEYKIAKLRAEQEKAQPSQPVSTTETVIDELRVLSEIRPLLNALIDFASKCFRRHDRHPNPYIKQLLHWRAEQELTKISLLLIGASRWAAKAEISEARETGVSLAAAAARVAEAQAMRPIISRGGSLTLEELEELTRRLRPNGINFDEELRRRGL